MSTIAAALVNLGEGTEVAELGGASGEGIAVSEVS